MKNTQMNGISQSTLSSFELNKQKQEDLFSKCNKKCVFQNDAYQYCAEEGCRQNAVICQNDNCKCQQLHKNCNTFFRVNKFHDKINNKIIRNTAQYEQQMSKNVDKIKDKVSDMQDMFKQMLKTFGLNKSDLKIKQRIINYFDINSQQKKKKISGNIFYQHQSGYKQSQKLWSQYSLQKYRNVVKQAQQQIIPYFQKINTLLTYMHVYHNKYRQTKDYFIQSKVLISDKKNQLLQNQTNYLVKSLNEFYEIKSIKNIYSIESNKLVHNSKQTFIQSIEGKQNLLFLMKNAYDKRFGAFTQLKFDKSNDYPFKTQNNCVTLISLNTYHKQSIMSVNNSIRYNKDTNTIQIRQTSTQLYANSIHLKILFQYETIKSQLIFKASKHPTRKDYYGNYQSITYYDINGRQKQDYPKGLPITNLQVYQIFGNKIIPQQSLENPKIQKV